MCPRSSDPLYIVSYYIKRVSTSWTHSKYSDFDLVWDKHCIKKLQRHKLQEIEIFACIFHINTLKCQIYLFFYFKAIKLHFKLHNIFKKIRRQMKHTKTYHEQGVGVNLGYILGLL